jgi:hypothetical protein
MELVMSDGREERKEQEERRKWEEEHKEPRSDPQDRQRDWERDGRPERRDSRAVTNRLSAQGRRPYAATVPWWKRSCQRLSRKIHNDERCETASAVVARYVARATCSANCST